MLTNQDDIKELKAKIATVEVTTGYQCWPGAVRSTQWSGNAKITVEEESPFSYTEIFSYLKKPILKGLEKIFSLFKVPIYKKTCQNWLNLELE